MADWSLFEGDALDVLRTLAAGSVGAVVTDPPYGLVEPRSVVGLNRAYRDGRTADEKAARRGGGRVGLRGDVMATIDGAGPTDAELEAALAWVWAQGGGATNDHKCALSWLLEWYERQRAVVAAAKDLEEAHYSWDTRDPEPGSPLARLGAALLAARA